MLISRKRTAITVVEVLVTVSVVGILASILIPAVFSAKENSRQLRCKNNLKQISLGILQHHEAQGRFPSGGWGYTWVGVPGRGSGRKQPGGWIYSLLPYIDQLALHELGENRAESERRSASAKRLATPVDVLNCPSRRIPDVWPTSDSRPHYRNPKETETVFHVARSDYVANGGDLYASVIPGPANLAEGDDPAFDWPNTKLLTGICFLRSEQRLAGVIDGTSNTYLLGEKYLGPDYYDTGTDPGDNDSMFAGYCIDVVRFGFVPPYQDRLGYSSPFSFGSAHSTGCNFAMCDGSVKTVSYSVDLEVHRRTSNRNDVLRE